MYGEFLPNFFVFLTFLKGTFMKRTIRFSILEMMVVIAIILILMGMIMPVLELVRDNAKKTKAKVSARSIGLTLVTYAEDDVKTFKMPYPLPKGEEKAWGNSKKVWSTSVAEMLFEQKYMKKGEESQLISAGRNGSNYTPMKLDDNTVSKNRFWNSGTELDFQIYCEKSLTSNAGGKIILVATYDNDDIRDCQFKGSGWVVFYADKTTDFIKRAKSRDFDPDASTPIVSVNEIEGKISGTGIVLRKDIAAADGGPGTFGSNLGGGSTELMGKRDSDAVYKALVR